MKANLQVKRALMAFIVFLLLSGITAFPIQTELNFLMHHLNWFPLFLQDWIRLIHQDMSNTPQVMFYGTDWLAFAHIVIAMFFMPVFVDPVKHKANIVIGMIACIAIFPLAFICGPIRGIPFFHQLIDCSFGVFGFLFLLFIYKKINRIERANNTRI